MFSPRSILVATDFSSTAAQAAQAALRLAQAFGSTLHVVSCVEQVAGYGGVRLTRVEDAPELLQVVVGEAFTQLAQVAKEQLQGLPEAQWQLRVGRPAQEILAAAEDTQADLVVLGTRAATGLDRFLRGSVAETVIERSSRPVLSLAEAFEPSRSEPILVAVDFSLASQEALEAAEGLARILEVPLHLVAVLEPPRSSALWQSAPTEPEELARERVLGQLEHFAGKTLRSDTARVYEVMVGGLTESLQKVSEVLRPQLIAMGTHGQEHWTERLLGGGTLRMLRTCGAPLLTASGQSGKH